jgi:acyl-homoserine lactone acylase PvdQ
MKLLPLEFYILWMDWEPWTPYDSLTIQIMLQYFTSFDWFLEIVRHRLTEVYDKDVVDRILPWKEDDYFYKNVHSKKYIFSSKFSN